MDKGTDDKSLTETVVLVAGVVVLAPIVARGMVAVAESAVWAGQAATNVVKDQIDKRKKVKVEEVEED